MTVLLGATAPPVAAQGHHVCLTSRVPEPFVLPDGSVHKAGRVSLCTRLNLSPSMGVHRLWLDGEGAMLILSRRSAAEATPEIQPALLFRRAPGSVLEFVGFVVPEGRQAWSYTLQRGFGRKKADAQP